MVKRAKPAAKRASAGPTFAKVSSGELLTPLDFVRFAVSRFNEAKLVFAHGTTDPVAEAAFLISEALHLHPDQFESFATARVASFDSLYDAIARTCPLGDEAASHIRRSTRTRSSARRTAAS